MTVKVDTSPLPPQAAAAPVPQAPAATAAPVFEPGFVDPSAERIAELERRLHETQARLEQTPAVAVGAASSDSGGDTSS